MKKRIVAVLLGCLLAFSGCSFSGFPDIGGNSSNNSSASSSNSSDNTSGDGVADGAHTDENDDGICDDCGISVVQTVDFYAVNDLHGKLVDSGNVTGVGGLTTYLEEAAANNPNTVVLSSGDMWQGGAESNLTRGALATEWMNATSFVSMTLGNHEFDWGSEYIRTNAELADFPFLAINVYDTKTNRRADYCEASVMVECGEVQIGVIGAIGDCLSSISSDKTEGITFKTGSALTALVKAESARLRAEGADFIVYSLHDGSGGQGGYGADVASYYDVSLSNGYVDLVFEGHTHKYYTFQDKNGVYHLQGGGDNRGVSHAVATINFANGNSEVTNAAYVSNVNYKNRETSPTFSKLLEKYSETIGKATEVVGFNGDYRSSEEILAKCAELYYRAGVTRWGEEYDIVLGGGYMTTRSPYTLSVGAVQYGTLLTLLPFDNPLVLCSISGKNLRARFLNSTKNYHVYCRENLGTIEDNETYYIVTDSYSSQYKPNGLTEIERYDEVTFSRDLLADYIRDGGFAS